jgi:hypothetical protein
MEGIPVHKLQFLLDVCRYAASFGMDFWSIAGYQYIVVLILPYTYHHLRNVLQSEMLFWCEVIEYLVMGLTY